MKRNFCFFTVAFCSIFSFFFCTGLLAQVNVTTQHNDLRRTGWNYKETKLTQSNVNTSSFGKLFTRTVDDQIYTQPLVVTGVTIGSKVRNVVYVATVNNTLYAFDADSASASSPLWQVSLTPSGYRSVIREDMSGACGGGGNYKDFSGRMGTVGTPVIDPATGTLYVVAHSIATNGSGIHVQYLHAIDIRTGAEKTNSPVYITATSNGWGDGSINGVITFNQQHENQRPGLLLYNGVVYISWASYCDWAPYHGWVIGYDAATLQRKYSYNDTPEGVNGGIWQSGQAPAADNNGFIYIATGNGSVGRFSNPNDTTNRGESLLKMSTQSGNLKVADFFTPHEWEAMEEGDLDYGCDGVLLIPNTNLSVSGSKESYLYVVNNTAMGATTSTDAGAKQIININASFRGEKHIHGTPVYYAGPNQKEWIYVWAENGLLKQIPFNRKNKLFDTGSVVLGSTILPNGMPGAMLSVTSNARKANTGILWAVHPYTGDANHDVVPGILQAYAANDVTHELWNSNQNASRDGLGSFAKFVCPTIANGKVYMSTFSNQLVVYGLLASQKLTQNKTANEVNSIAPVGNDSRFSVYPNPARGQVKIQYSSSSRKVQNAEILVVNSSGKEVYRQKESVNPGNNTIALHLPQGMPAGVYLVHLFTDDYFGETRKLTIEK